MKELSGYPYGETLRRASFSALTLTETEYLPGLKLPNHSHEQAYLCFVLTGSFTEVLSDHSRSCRPSTLIFHPAGEMHSDRFHTSARCFNIQLDRHWLEKMSEHGPVIRESSLFNGGLLAELAARLYDELLEVDELSALVVEGLALEIIAGASRQHLQFVKREPPRWLKHSREIIIMHFAESISLSKIAELVGIHPVHLARAFRKHYGCTVGEYLRQARVDFARRELTVSDAPLSEVACAAGFSDQSQFSKTFRRHTGRTPADFRKISRLR